MIYSGSTLEEALLKAEADMGRSREELVYTFSEHKKSFLKSADVTVEVSGFKESGKLEIVDGTARYIPGDILPVIQPGDNIRIFVNDKMILAPTEINAEDIIQIKVQNTTAERKARVTVSDDLLEAIIDVVYISEKTFKVKDTAASADIKVEAELLKEIPPSKYTKQELLDILKENGVKWGYNLENLDKAAEGGRYLAASGTKCTPTENDYIKYFFTTEAVKKPIESEGRVDYYNIGEIEFIAANTLLASRYEGHDGKPGCDIRGNIILPEKRKQVKLLKGPGTRLSDDKNSVISDIEGMPSIKNGAICVYSAYIQNEDVSIKTGNIDFDGDVVIKGNVQEGMKIKSGNSITIYGDAINSDISSGGNIKIEKNVIGCEIRAGEKQLNEIEALKYIKSFGEFIIKICQWYNNTIQSASAHVKENPGMVFKMIFESRFGSFRETIDHANVFFTRNVVKEDIAKLWETLCNIAKLIETGKMANIDILLNTLKVVNEFIESYNILLAPADIFVQYCQNSTLISTNSVEIKGKGCYNTIITAENAIKVSGVPGVFRGGKMYAKNSVYVGEAGSSAGVSTVLRTSKEGTVEAKIAYPNTIIMVDEHIYKVEYPVKNLKAFMSKGELVVEKLKL